jgi:polyhydroxyalkanoate synthesis regulator phasin
LEEPSIAVPAVAVTTQTRSARARKRNKVETIVFYSIYVITLVLLYIGALYFGRETRVEGQVIPPPNMTLGNEAWIVGDFRTQAFGIVDDLAANRAPDLRDIQEAQGHVQRVQADVAAREERIRLLRERVQAAKDEIASIIKQAHDTAQQIWDNPGAQLEDEYNSRLNQLQKLFVDRAKALNLKYQPDDTYHSPEVWANAYRLALYDVPAGVDSTKEHQWLEDQIKQWRNFTKSIDDRQKQLREQAAQIQLATTPKVSDLNARIDELKGRIDSTQAEEDPLKEELQQAHLDLSKAQTKEAGEDPVAYKQLYSLSESAITKHLPVASNGRFSWRHVEKDYPFAEGEKTHHYYLLVRAIRSDGRQYWAFLHLSLVENDTLSINIEPSDFITTKAILRPDLSPEEQQQ